eukprot:9170032-Pyramimonas_sp.AAC.1
MRFIVDTGCGSNLIPVKYLREAGMVDRISLLAAPITLDAAGGQSKAFGAVEVASDRLSKGGMEGIVMPETPSVTSGGPSSA